MRQEKEKLKGGSNSNESSKLSEDNVLALANKVVAALSQYKDQSKGLHHIQSTLQKVYDAGGRPSAFTIDPGDNNNMRSMGNVANQRWSDVMEDATTDASDPLGHPPTSL